MRECDRGDTTTITDHGRGDAGDEDPSHAYGGEEAISSIRETQMFDMNVGADANITSLDEEVGVGGWYVNREPSPPIFSPARKQSRRRDATEVAEEGLAEMEMSVDATEAATQSTGRLMWADFTSAVKALPRHVYAGGDAKGGWVRPKRGRGSHVHTGGGGRPAAKEPDFTGSGDLNLNLSPEKLDGNETLRGKERIPSTTDRVAASRGGCRGTCRGVGRVRRPPAVQPRYQSTASASTTNSPFPIEYVQSTCMRHSWSAK